MADVVYICSEILCYFQNNVSNIARNILVSNIVGFYSLEEIVDAKKSLFGEAEKLKTSGLVIDLPRCITRRNGEGRGKSEADDLVDL